MSLFPLFSHNFLGFFVSPFKLSPEGSSSDQHYYIVPITSNRRGHSEKSTSQTDLSATQVLSAQQVVNSADISSCSQLCFTKCI